MVVEIEKYDDFGRGICFINNKITFVPNTVPKDKVSIKIEKEYKNYNIARVIKYIKYSKLRVKEKCPYFNKCGGCVLQNIDYETSILYKKEKVINFLKKNKLNINPIVITNPNNYNYRNKINLKVINNQIGYYEEKTHNLILIDSCIIASKVINKGIDLIKDIGIKNGNVTLRSNLNEELLIIIYSNDKLNIDIDKIKSKVKLVGIVINDKIYYGEDFLFERLNNLLFKYSYDSFFQINPNIASKLFEIISSYINREDEVLDIYCGVGTLSLIAAKKTKSVIGIEIIENAVINANFNAKINGLNNVNFLLNDASKAITKINRSFNKVIVDPPRAGLTKTVIEAIKKIKPKKIIYVSCDFHTLVRDILLLSDIYEIEDAYILDMFSYSYHVETICVLKIH